jgi:anti-anti-sigma regulatory factor
VAVLPRTSTDASTRALTWTFSRNGDGALLVCSGEVRGREVGEFTTVLDRLMLASDEQVYVDLSAVNDWSTLAQAMLLSADRRPRSRGRHLVLVGPSAALRRSTYRIDVFGQITTIDELPASPGSSRRGGDYAEVGGAQGVGVTGRPDRAPSMI